MNSVEHPNRVGSKDSPMRRRASDDGSSCDLYADVERNRVPRRPPKKSSAEKEGSSRRETQSLRGASKDRTSVAVDLSYSLSELDVRQTGRYSASDFDYEVPAEASVSSEEEWAPKKSSKSPAKERSERSQRTTHTTSLLSTSSKRRGSSELLLQNNSGRPQDASVRLRGSSNKSPGRPKAQSSRPESRSRSRSTPKAGVSPSRKSERRSSDTSRSKSRLRSTSTGRQSTSSARRSSKTERSLSPVRHASVESSSSAMSNSSSAIGKERPPRSSKTKRTSATVWSPETGQKTSGTGKSSDRGSASDRGSSTHSRTRSRSSHRQSDSSRRSKEMKKLEERKEKAREKIASQMTTRTWRAQLAVKFGRQPPASTGMGKNYRIPAKLVCKSNFADDIPDDLTAIP